MGVGTIVARYAGRWNLKYTFQESRAQFHSETTRGWSLRTVLRAMPCFLGLYSVVALQCDVMPAMAWAENIDRPGISVVAFSDALCTVGLQLCSETVLREFAIGPGLKKLPEPVLDIFYAALAPAAWLKAKGHQSRSGAFHY